MNTTVLWCHNDKDLPMYLTQHLESEFYSKYFYIPTRETLIAQSVAEAYILRKYNFRANIKRPFGSKPHMADTKMIEQFSISHSYDYTMCAFNKKIDIGADCERITDIKEDVARHFLTSNEYKTWSSTYGIPQKNMVAIRIWTIKEALVKLLGVGLGKVNLRDIEVTFIDYRQTIAIIEYQDYIFHSESRVIKDCIFSICSDRPIENTEYNQAHVFDSLSRVASPMRIP